MRHLAFCDREVEEHLQGIPNSFTTDSVYLAATGKDHRVFMEEVLKGAAEDEKAVAPKVGRQALMNNPKCMCVGLCMSAGGMQPEAAPCP